jgi:hypothetical protein
MRFRNSAVEAITLRWIEEEARILTRDVSSKFVVEPTIEEISSDLLIALKRFNHSVRSKARQRERDIANSSTSNQPGEDPGVPPPGLGTNLRPTGGGSLDNTTQVSKEVEAFLYDVQRELLEYIENAKLRDTRKSNLTTAKINSLLTTLKQRKDIVVVETDKTNSIRIIPTSKYSVLVTEHLSEDAVETTYEHLIESRDKAKSKLEQFKYLLSENEYNYIKSTISKCNIPTVRLLIKDHKDKDEHGDFPLRLVVPAKNFTAGFPHVGQ